VRSNPDLQAYDDLAVENTDITTLLQQTSRAQGIRVPFADGSVAPLSRAAVDSVATVIMQLSEAATRLGLELHVEVRGFASASGSTDMNRQLSELRARAVAQLLASSGVPSELLTARGMGTISSADDSEGRMASFRVFVR
jgi:outer membrane protein OmpA-like peptidoglycan-associated protein